MLQERLGIDEKDLMILTLSMKDSQISQAQIAAKLKISQPSVNARIYKLKKKGLLATQVGIELDKTSMLMARVDFTAAKAQGILDSLKTCSFFVNGFILSGTNNASILVIGPTLKKIEAIVDEHLRSNADVHDLNISVVVSTAKPFVCTVDLEADHACKMPGSCTQCPIEH